MNIIIVGAGEIGRYLASELSQDAHNISVIERDAELAQDLELSIDAKVVRGDGSEISSLVEANIEACDLFLALTSENTVNITSASMAKSLGVKKVVSRVHPGIQREEWLFDYRGHFGLDHLFSSERLSALELSKFIRSPHAIMVEELARGKIELQQVRVSKKSPFIGKTLREIRPPEQTRIGLISRSREHFVPNAQTKIEVGDLLTVFGQPNKLKDFTKKIIKDEQSTKDLRIVIFGGGEYGFALAQMLENWGCKVRIFEEDPERCQFLSEELHNTTIIHADATELPALQDEQIHEADFFVATSESDEDNVMSCMQAHNLGIKKCLTLVHRADYARTISASGRAIGIKAAISPREATRRDIERFITDDPFHVVKKFISGEVLELIVGEKAKVMGRKIQEIEFPEGCILVGIQRGSDAWVPGPDDEMQADDLVYTMVTKEAKKRVVQLLK